MQIILTGSLAIDRIMDFPGQFKDHLLPDKLHNLNISFNIERLEEKRGGTAGNIGYNLSLLGETARIVASAGNDFGLYLDYLHGLALPIPTDGIEIQDDLTTASAYIITDRDDNQITGFFMGAMARETTADLSTLDPEETMVVLAPGNKGDMLRYAATCKERGIPYVFDPGQTLPFLTPDEIRILVNGANILISNDYELLMVMNRTGLTEAEIRGQVEMLVTTYGREGSRIAVAEGDLRVPICAVETVKDPTGAGDAYRAGLLKGLMTDCDLDQAGRLAATAAAYAIEQYGTQEHNYTLDDFCERYKANFSETCPIAASARG